MTTRNYGNTVLDVTKFGAKGDGAADDTEAFARAIGALPRLGGTVFAPDGLYLIDPVRFPGWDSRTPCGIRLRSHMRLFINAGATLISKPTDSPRSDLLLVPEGASNVEITGGGHIIGDRLLHAYAGTTTHEWGHVLRVRRARHITVSGITISEATGDGLSISGHDIVLDRVRALYNRRQGLTIGGYTSVVVVRNSEFSHTGKMALGSTEHLGTRPMHGIDIEPDSGDVTNVAFENLLLTGNQGAGLGSYVKPREVDMPVLRGFKLTNVNATNNGMGFDLIRMLDTQIEGGSSMHGYWSGLRAAPGTSGSLDGMTFANNRNKNGDKTRAPRTIDGEEYPFTASDIDNDAGEAFKVGTNLFA